MVRVVRSKSSRLSSGWSNTLDFPNENDSVFSGLVLQQLPKNSWAQTSGLINICATLEVSTQRQIIWATELLPRKEGCVKWVSGMQNRKSQMTTKCVTKMRKIWADSDQWCNSSWLYEGKIQDLWTSLEDLIKKDKGWRMKDKKWRDR